MKRPLISSKLPPLPKPDEEGSVPAVEYVRASIARDVIRERKALGITQEQLTKLSGVRQETICRLETGRHSPTVRTVEKIERALKRAAGRLGRGISHLRFQSGRRTKEPHC